MAPMSLECLFGCKWAAGVCPLRGSVHYAPEWTLNRRAEKAKWCAGKVCVSGRDVKDLVRFGTCEVGAVFPMATEPTPGRNVSRSKVLGGY